MAKKHTMRAGSGAFVVKTSDTQFLVRRQGKAQVHTLSKISKRSIKRASKTFGPALSRLADR